jgi:hypothetical protein
VAGAEVAPDDAEGIGRVGAAATDDGAAEADAIGATGENAGVALATGVTWTEVARGARLIGVLNPMPSRNAVTTPPASSGRAPIPRVTGNSSRHRGQNPETGIVL